MRVLFSIPTLGGGGAERQVRMMLEQLPALGVEVGLFSRIALDDATALEAHGVRIYPAGAGGNHSPSLALTYRAAIHDFRPWIVQSFLTQMDILSALVRPRGTRWILSERASAPHYVLGQGSSTDLKNRLRRFLGKGADLVIANSRRGLEYWSDAKAGQVIPNGIDFAAVETIERGRYAVDPRLAGRRTMLSIGRLAAQKQMQVLIDAADLIQRRLPDFRLIIIGEGPERGELERRIAALGLEDIVRIEGFQPDSVGWLKSVELFASASLYEGQPNAVLEAAAAGTPMILSDIPEHREAVPSGAAYLTPGDSAGFAASALHLFADTVQARELAFQARSEVARLSPRQLGQAYREAYAALLAQA